MSDGKYVIYRYWSPSGKSYIGQTNQTLNNRSGKFGQNYKTSTKFYNAIQKYGFIWFKTHREILQNNLTKEQANNLERYYINYYNSINNGYNIQSGGTFNPAELSNKKVVGINCYTKKLEFFDSITLAAIDKGLKRRSINKVVLHEKNHYTIGGYVWVFLNEWNNLSELQKKQIMNIMPQIRNKKRKVVCVTTGEHFESIKQAQQINKCNNIGACCRGVINDAGIENEKKLYWRYDEEGDY